MAESDVYPLTPDYGYSFSRQPAVLAVAAASGEEFRRLRTAHARTLTLIHTKHSLADYKSLRDFESKMGADHFTFFDPLEERDYSVYFDAPVSATPIGNEEYNIQATIREAIGKPLRNYPQTPLNDISSQGEVVSDGVVFVYSGYGYTITGTFTDVELDGVSQGVTSPNFTVAMGLHILKVLPETASVTLNVVQ